MEDDQKVSLVKLQFGVLTQLFKNASALHESVLGFILFEERDKQNTWFSSITKYNQGSIENFKIWL